MEKGELQRLLIVILLVGIVAAVPVAAEQSAFSSFWSWVRSFFSGSPTGAQAVDSDGDGVEPDNCPDVYNPGQENIDDDSAGDACDPLYAFSPAKIAQGATVTVALTGNFSSDATFGISGSDANIQSQGVINSSSLVSVVSVPLNSSLGLFDVYLVQASADVLLDAFEVVPGPFDESSVELVSTSPFTVNISTADGVDKNSFTITDAVLTLESNTSTYVLNMSSAVDPEGTFTITFEEALIPSGSYDAGLSITVGSAGLTVQAVSTVSFDLEVIVPSIPGYCPNGVFGDGPGGSEPSCDEGVTGAVGPCLVGEACSNNCLCLTDAAGPYADLFPAPFGFFNCANNFVAAVNLCPAPIIVVSQLQPSVILPPCIPAALLGGFCFPAHFTCPGGGVLSTIGAAGPAAPAAPLFAWPPPGAPYASAPVCFQAGGVCGDGNVDPGEDCDDGCPDGVPGVCEVGIDDCTNSCHSNCKIQECGDAILCPGAPFFEGCEVGIPCPPPGICAGPPFFLAADCACRLPPRPAAGGGGGHGTVWDLGCALHNVCDQVFAIISGTLNPMDARLAETVEFKSGGKAIPKDNPDRHPTIQACVAQNIPSHIGQPSRLLPLLTVPVNNEFGMQDFMAINLPEAYKEINPKDYEFFENLKKEVLPQVSFPTERQRLLKGSVDVCPSPEMPVQHELKAYDGLSCVRDGQKIVVYYQFGYMHKPMAGDARDVVDIFRYELVDGIGNRIDGAEGARAFGHGGDLNNEGAVGGSSKQVDELAFPIRKTVYVHDTLGNSDTKESEIKLSDCPVRECGPCMKVDPETGECLPMTEFELEQEIDETGDQRLKCCETKASGPAGPGPVPAQLTTGKFRKDECCDGENGPIPPTPMSAQGVSSKVNACCGLDPDRPIGAGPGPVVPSPSGKPDPDNECCKTDADGNPTGKPVSHKVDECCDGKGNRQDEMKVDGKKVDNPCCTDPKSIPDDCCTKNNHFQQDKQFACDTGTCRWMYSASRHDDVASLGIPQAICTQDYCACDALNSDYYRDDNGNYYSAWPAMSPKTGCGKMTTALPPGVTGPQPSVFDPGSGQPPMQDAKNECKSGGGGGAPLCVVGVMQDCPAGAVWQLPCKKGTQICVAPGVWSPCIGAVPPNAEVCNGADDNCDGAADDGIICGCVDGQRQECGSDVGECQKGTKTCVQSVWGNCEGEKGPSAEVCDRKDNDCDGSIDEPDADNDGFSAICNDCDDLNAAIHPGAQEICDGLDNNCNGEIDEGFPLPCDREICDGVDNNGNGVVDEGFDKDRDKFTICSGDCDDLNRNVNPGRIEICNLIDDNCDGLIDENFDADGDKYSVCGGDCNDADVKVHIGAPEECNNKDDDCNGAVDDGCHCIEGQKRACGVDVGECKLGEQECVDNTWDTCDAVLGTAEFCNGLDDDCDGVVDNAPDQDGDGSNMCDDCDDNDPEIKACPKEEFFQCKGYEIMDKDGDGSHMCSGDCNDDNPNVYLGAYEICNDGLDNNCDGIVDNDCIVRSRPSGGRFPIIETQSPCGSIFGEIDGCCYVKGEQPSDIGFGEPVKAELAVPPGKELLVPAFDVVCGEKRTVYLSKNLPPAKEVEVKVCYDGVCRPAPSAVDTNLVCGDYPFGQLLRGQRVKSPPFEVPITIMEGKVLSSEDSVFEFKGDSQWLGRIAFAGEVEGVGVKARSVVKRIIPPANLRFMSPPVGFAFNGVHGVLSASGEFAFTEVPHVGADSAAIYQLTGREWKLLGGDVDKAEKVVRLDVENILELQSSEIILAVMGVHVDEPDKVTITEVTEGVFSSNAVLLVHGLGVASWTYDQLIADILATPNQPKIYVIDYSSVLSSDELTDLFIGAFKERQFEAENWVVVAHSLGGIIVTKGFDKSFNNPELGLDVSRVKAVILTGVPKKGTPLAAKILDWTNSVLKVQTIPVWNVNSKLLQELAEAKPVPFVPTIKYYVIAGDVPMIEWLSKAVFGERPNDGMVGVTEVLDADPDCQVSFLEHASHKGLIDDLNPIRQIELLVAENIPEESVVGKNVYGRFVLEDCENTATVYIFGKKSDVNAAPAGACGCPNGVCNIDENYETCSFDCPAPPEGRECFAIAVGIYALLLSTLVLTIVYAVRTERRKRSRKLLYVIYGLTVASLVMFIIHYLVCAVLMPAALVVFGLILIILFIDAFARANGNIRWH